MSSHSKQLARKEITDIAMFWIYEELEGSNPTLYGTMLTYDQAKDIFGGKYKYYTMNNKHIQYGVEVTPRVIPQKAGPHV